MLNINSLVAPAPLKRQGRSRSISLISGGILLLGVLILLSSRLLLSRAYENLAQSTSRCQHAQLQEVSLRLKVAKADSARAFIKRVDTEGLQSEQWLQRNFALHQVKMQRTSLNALLHEISRTKNRMFGASSFDISVAHSDESLFTQAGRADSELNVSIEGHALLRTKEQS